MSCVVDDAWGGLHSVQGTGPGVGRLGQQAKTAQTHQTPPSGTRWRMSLLCTAVPEISSSDGYTIYVQVQAGCTAHAAQQRVLCCMH